MGTETSFRDNLLCVSSSILSTVQYSLALSVSKRRQFAEHCSAQGPHKHQCAPGADLPWGTSGSPRARAGEELGGEEWSGTIFRTWELDLVTNPLQSSVYGCPTGRNKSIPPLTQEVSLFLDSQACRTVSYSVPCPAVHTGEPCIPSFD